MKYNKKLLEDGIYKLRKEEDHYKNWGKIDHTLRKRRLKFCGNVYRMENSRLKKSKYSVY